MALRARDLLPLVDELSRQEQVRLARLALAAAARQTGGDAEVYRAQPTGDGVFSSEEDALAWDSDGWEEFSEPR